MITSERKGYNARNAVSAMIRDPLVIARVASVWRDDLLGDRNHPCSVIARLAVAYFNEYDEPPKYGIAGLVQTWGESYKDDTAVRAVNDMLNAVFTEDSDPATPCGNPEMEVDRIGTFVKRVALDRLTSEVRGYTESNQIDKASALVSGFRQVEIGAGSFFGPVTDEVTMSRYMDDDGAEDLIQYRGEAKYFWRGQLTRGSFVAILAAEKSGKSMDLVDMAVRGISQRRRVAYFEVGDMTQAQVCRRIASRIAEHPRDVRGMSFPCDLQIPVGLTITRAGEIRNVEVVYGHRHFDEPLSSANLSAYLHRFRNKVVRSNDDYLRLVCSPSGTVNVQSIESTIRTWSHDGWTPDVVVIDYADILAPPSHASKMDERGQINATWQQMRSMSQSLHALVVTATQADAGSYGRDLITRKNFSGDKRKLAHVTAMMGINMTAEEKRKGITRRNWIVMREGPYSPDEVIYVGSCLAVCNPWVVSAR